MPSLTRRSLLASLTGTACLSGAAGPGRAQERQERSPVTAGEDKTGNSGASGGGSYVVENQEPFNGQTRRLRVSRDGRYVASFIFSTDYPTHFRLKPEWHPVCTPAGVPVTDSHGYCFIHHQGVMCGHGKVKIEGRDKPIDFYRKLNFPDEEREDRWHRDFNLFEMGPSGIQRITEASWEEMDSGEGVRIDLVLEWQTRELRREKGETALREARRYELSQRGPLTVIDHYTKLAPAAGSAVLMADRHSFCGVRVHDLIDVEDGGTMRDSEGRIDPTGNYWDAEGERKAPRWVDCSGKIGGAEAGMALIAHPDNVRNQFYVREFGLMEVSAMLGEDVTIDPRTPFRFASRYVAHDGPLTTEVADELHAEFGRSKIEIE